jgi:uncharacterized protein
MKKRTLFVLFAFLPFLEQIFAKYIGNYFFGLMLRIAVLVIFPILYVKYSQNKNPFLVFGNKVKFKILILNFFLGLFSILFVYFLFHNLIDNNQIIEQVGKLYPLTISIYILVGFLVTFLNPLIEEFFWRGFVFRNYLRFKGGIWIGSLFALHHIVILYNWLSLSLLITTTILLAIVGVFFNYLYRKYDSIYPPLVCHMGADLGIIIVGFIILF